MRQILCIALHSLLDTERNFGEMIMGVFIDQDSRLSDFDAGSYVQLKESDAFVSNHVALELRPFSAFKMLISVCSVRFLGE